MERWEGAGCSGARPFAEGRAPVGESAPLRGRARPCGGERAPEGESAPLWGRARPCCLLDRQGAQAPIDYLIGRGFGDFLLFFDAAKS
jgi:hypothetical protein